MNYLTMTKFMMSNMRHGQCRLNYYKFCVVDFIRVE